MRLLNVQDSNQGFTLIEGLVVIVIIGIVSAIAAPSLFSMVNRSKINSAQAEVQGVLQEAQRQSIRSSRSCNVTLSANTITGNCLTTGNLTLDQVSLRSASNNAAISSFWFNHKGELFINDPLGTAPQRFTAPITFVISASSSTVQKCLVFSAPLGLLRSGTYTGATSTTTETSCMTQL
ncbi:MAG: hypothetical protein Kow00121_49190 [Elainellaceae cyanobacterium]